MAVNTLKINGLNSDRRSDRCVIDVIDVIDEFKNRRFSCQKPLFFEQKTPFSYAKTMGFQVENRRFIFINHWFIHCNCSIYFRQVLFASLLLWFKVGSINSHRNIIFDHGSLIPSPSLATRHNQCKHCFCPRCSFGPFCHLFVSLWRILPVSSVTMLASVNGLYTPFGSPRFPGDRNPHKLTLCSQR